MENETITQKPLEEEEPYVDPYLLPRLVNDITLVLTEEEQLVQRKKDNVLRCKCLVLEKMGKPILTRYQDLNPREKKKYVEMVANMFKNVSESEIISEFNLLCVDTILTEASDVSSYPVSLK